MWSSIITMITHEMTSQNSVMGSTNGCRNHGVSQLCGHKIITMMTHEMTSQNSVMGSRKGCPNQSVSSVTIQTVVVITNSTVCIEYQNDTYIGKSKLGHGLD